MVGSQRIWPERFGHSGRQGEPEHGLRALRPRIPFSSRTPAIFLDLRATKPFVTGIANKPLDRPGALPQQPWRRQAAQLAVTYLPDEKGVSEARCASSRARLEPRLVLPLNVQNPEQIEAVFSEIGAASWGHFDVLITAWPLAARRSWSRPTADQP